MRMVLQEALVPRVQLVAVTSVALGVLAPAAAAAQELAAAAVPAALSGCALQQ